MPQIRRTAREMFPLIERYLESQMTQKTFSAEHGLSVAVLGYWLAKYRKQTAAAAGPETGAFLELLPRSTPAEQALLEVVYPHGVRLRFFSLLPPAYLEQLLTLERAPGRPVV